MSFLRVAAYEMPGSFEVWDSTVGEYLRNNPHCIAAKGASDGTTWLVASEWTSREAMETDMASPEYLRVLEEVTTKMGISSDVQPTFLFQGDIGARA